MALCFDRPGLPPRGHIKLSVIIRDTLVVVLDQRSISSANWGGRDETKLRCATRSTSSLQLCRRLCFNLLLRGSPLLNVMTL